MQTPALYAIEEREIILDLFEEVSGARLMCNYMRFGGVMRDLTEGWEDRAKYLAHDRMPRALDKLDKLISGNEIVKARGRGVGYLSPEDLIALSVSGPQIRAAGIPYDIRKAEPYCIYDRFDFDIPTLPEGDIYARYYIRLLEARESVKILQQASARHSQGRNTGRQGRLRVARRRKAKPTTASKRPRASSASTSSATARPTRTGTTCVPPASSTSTHSGPCASATKWRTPS